MFSEESTEGADRGLFVEEAPGWNAVAGETPQQLHEHEWAVGFLYAACDIVWWIILYGFVSYARRDSFYSGPFEFVLVDVIALSVLVQALYIIGGYDRNTETRSLGYAAEHILAVASAAAISALIIYTAAAYQESMKPSRAVLLLSFLVFLPVSLTYRRMIRNRAVRFAAQRTFLVIGSGPVAARFYEVYKNSPNQQRLEFVDDDPERVGLKIAGDNSPIVQGDLRGKLARLDQHYSGVILAADARRLTSKLLQQLVQTQFQRTRVYTIESFYETHWRHVPVHTIDRFWPLQMGFQLASTSPYHYLKRLADVLAAGALLVICAPLMVLITIAIWLTSGRPAIFRQPRVGQYGRQFTAYKFRTMIEAANIDGNDIYTRANDVRVTRLGRLLRKLRLDELPQLWNVLKGNMSMIGPRPEWSKCVERYEKKIPLYHFRHLVKPGITGWAQVNYPYGESEEDALNKLQYDLYYIRHYSLKLDAMIVLKTVHTMLFGKGR